MKTQRNLATAKAQNSFFQYWICGMLLLMAACFAVVVQASDDAFPELQPDPAYLPNEVVGIQMRALGKNNQPFSDAGIEITFRFASPANKVVTGPLDKFSTLFDLPTYAPMLEHDSLTVGPATIEGDVAYVPVLIRNSNQDPFGYMFVLSKQTEGPYVDCWMTDRVALIQITDEEQLVM